MDIKKIDLLDFTLIALTAITFIIPGFQSIDQMFPEFLYLSIIQVITTLYIIIFKKDELGQNLKNISVISSFVFLVLSVLSYFVAINKQLTFIEFIYFFLFYLTFFNSLILFQKKSFNFYINLILILLTIESTKVLIEFIKIYNFEHPILRSPYYAGFSSNVNITAFSILFKLPVILYKLFKLKSSNKILTFLLYGVFFISLFAIFLCYSRGAIITLFIISLFYILLLFKSNSIKFKFFNFILVLFLAYGSNKLALINSGSDIIQRASTFYLKDQNSSLNYRLGYYKDAIHAGFQKPFIGWGLGNWKIVGIKYAKDRMKEYQVGYHTHNDFLQLFAEIGILGCLSYIIFLFYPIIPIVKSFKSLNDDNKYFFSFLGLMFLILFIDSNINFPRARPTSIVNISLLIAFTYSQIKIRIDE